MNASRSMLWIPLLVVFAFVPRVSRAERVEVPDEVLVDQNGKPVRLYTDLVKGRTVAINFVFTTCTTICSPMTAVFGRLQQEAGERLGKDVRLISISLDPRTDTPEKLKAYAEKFERREGWVFLTGPKERVTRVLKALGGYVAQKESHAPLTLLGHEPSGRWSRVNGIPTAARLWSELSKLEVPQASAAEADKAARSYFTDTELVDHEGRPHKFYSDLIRWKKVLINFAFASCTTSCSPVTANLARVQKLLGDRVGRDVHMITITVDPANDSPAKLKAFAAKFKAAPGWYFLSGSQKNVEAVLKKLGGYVDSPEKHLNAVLIGDAVTGNWVKALAMSPPQNLAQALERINAP